jgi:hypothetical protein
VKRRAIYGLAILFASTLAFFVSSNAWANCIIASNPWHADASRAHRHYVYQMDGRGCSYVIRVDRRNRRVISMDVVERPKNIAVNVAAAGNDIRVMMTNSSGFRGEDFYRIRYCYRSRTNEVQCGLSSNHVTVR